jgi:hypothetical protein
MDQMMKEGKDCGPGGCCGGAGEKPMTGGACGGKCGCMHHKMVPLMITLIGVLFLLRALSVLSAGLVDMLWPIALTLAGLVKLMGGKCKCC